MAEIKFLNHLFVHYYVHLKVEQHVQSLERRAKGKRYRVDVD